jgi:hypothetical protein
MKTHTISDEAMQNIMAICDYVLQNEECHYENIIDEQGADSCAAQNHVYRLVTHLLGEIADNPVKT